MAVVDVAIGLVMKNLNKARDSAMASTLKQRVGAILVKGNRVIASGTNQLRHQSTLRTGHWQGSLYAEIDCILNAIRTGQKDSPEYMARRKIKGSTMFVVRLKADDSFGLALPCEDCFEVIQGSKVKKVYFSTNQQTISEVVL